MAISRERRVHPVYSAFLVAALAIAVAAPAWAHIHAQRQSDQLARMRSIAAQAPPPATMNQLVINHDCNGPDLVRCQWTPDQNPDGLARTTQATLNRLAHHEVNRRCENIRSLLPQPLRSCSVQLEEHGHGVSVGLDPYFRLKDGKPVLLGTKYTMQIF